MIRPVHHGIQVWLCVEPVDFRKQMTGLATLVQDALGMDPFSAHLFVFTNRRRTQCRVLYWERCGFVLWHKRLERARFAWPRRWRGESDGRAAELPARRLRPVAAGSAPTSSIRLDVLTPGAHTLADAEPAEPATDPFTPAWVGEREPIESPLRERLSPSEAEPVEGAAVGEVLET